MIWPQRQGRRTPADGDDAVDLADEVVLAEAERVAGGLAAVEPGAGVGDHLDELAGIGGMSSLPILRSM